jgi:hypothetical protein
MWVNSGDVVIMGGDCRLSIHSVPKVFPCPCVNDSNCKYASRDNIVDDDMKCSVSCASINSYVNRKRSIDDNNDTTTTTTTTTAEEHNNSVHVSTSDSEMMDDRDISGGINTSNQQGQRDGKLHTTTTTTCHRVLMDSFQCAMNRASTHDTCTNTNVDTSGESGILHSNSDGSSIDVTDQCPYCHKECISYTDIQRVKRYLQSYRINLNVRQVFPLTDQK